MKLGRRISKILSWSLVMVMVFSVLWTMPILAEGEDTEKYVCKYEENEKKDCEVEYTRKAGDIVTISAFVDLPEQIRWQEHKVGTLFGIEDIILPSTLQAIDTDGTSRVVTGVTWAILNDMIFDPDIEELYYFAPILPLGYELEYDWLILPEIAVLIGESGQEQITPMSSVMYLDQFGQTQYSPETLPLLGGGATTLSSGWYTVSGNVNFTGTITISGDVHIILLNNSHLTVNGDGSANAGINVSGTSSLSIYAQTLVSGYMGRLTATSSTGGGAGIGGNQNQIGGAIVINGGNITSTGLGGGAGIGGGAITQDGAGTITSITINSGIITASSNGSGAGIGGGGYGASGTIIINGGTIISLNTGSGAGIGSGSRGRGGDINIHGGFVFASGGSGGAGIGGGNNGNVDSITINGGTIEANGGNSSFSNVGSSAGIGGGGGFIGLPTPDSGNISIMGSASVIARGGNSNPAFGTSGGAGIGTGGAAPAGGASGTPNVVISTSGTIIASGGLGGSNNGRNGAAIGHGGTTTGAGAEIAPTGSTTLHTITVLQSTNGFISPINTRVSSGVSPTFAVTANSGYEIEAITITGQATNVGTLTTFDSPDSHTFNANNVGGAVEVTATFREESPILINAEPPIINTQPIGDVVLRESFFNLSVSAVSTDGGNLTFQWFRNTTPSNVGGTPVSNATNATFIVPTDTRGTFYYYVVVTNTIADNLDGGVKTSSVASAVATVIIEDIPMITTPPGALAQGNVGTPFSVTLTAIGNPHNWSVVGGNLPNGLNLENSGIISGTPTTVGTSVFQVAISNVFGSSVLVEFSITINPEIPTDPCLRGHDASGDAATCTTDHICVRYGCNYIIEPRLGHSNPTGNWTSGYAATCTTASTRVEVCSRVNCNHIIAIEDVAALGHDWGDWNIVTPATIEFEGEKVRECNFCKTQQSLSIPRLEPTIDNVIREALDSDNPNIILTEDTGTKLSEELLLMIRESESLVRITLPCGLVITIDPDSITDQVIATDLDVSVIITNVTKEFNEVIVPANSIIIVPPTHGEFGFTFSFDLTVEQMKEAGLYGSNVSKFHVNVGGDITEVTYRLEVNPDGSATVTLNKASWYVVTAQDMIELNSEDTNKRTEVGQKSPETGDNLAMVLIWLATTMMALGGLAVAVDWKKKQIR